MITITKLTRTIQYWQSGDKVAENHVYQFAYLQLHNIAQKERKRNVKKYGPDNDMFADSVNNTTSLIHDAYIKLSNSKLTDIKTKRDFFLMITRVMRQILIDNARSLQAKKRQPLAPINGDIDKFEQLITMDKALDNFAIRYPRQSNVLKLKYLMGMKNTEICQLLECSSSLVEKDLKFSRCWLHSYIMK